LLVGLPGLFSPPPPEKTLRGLTQLLGRAVEGHVADADVAWEPRGGAVAELLRGRGVLFLAAGRPGAARDLHRAWVRLAPDGQPLAVTRSLRLSDTPFVDESGLVTHAERAAFASVALGRVQAVTLLTGLGTSAHGGVGLTPWLLARARTGTPLERTDIVFDIATGRVQLSLGARSLALTLPEHSASLKYDFARHALAAGAFPAHVLERAPYSEPHSVAWLDLSRTYLGGAATQLIGRVWFGLRHPIAPRLAEASARKRPAEPLARSWLPRARGLDASAGAPDAYFERTHFDVGGSGLTLVGFDMRQLELTLVAGTERPQALASVPGDGRIPRNLAAREHIVAVFNAGAETSDGRYAMHAGGRLLAPPEPNAASLVLEAAYGARLRPWPFGEQVPASVAGFTQRPAFLVQEGKVVAETQSGAPASVRARSALCATQHRQLVYAFADASDREGFAHALAAAGCQHALPLAIAPERLGLALVRLDARGFARQELAAGTTFDPRPLLDGTTRDFFTLSVRDVTPALPAGAGFAPDRGTQPSPAWLPGILRGEVGLGPLRIELFSLDAQRLEFRLRPGLRELGAKGAPWAGQLAHDGSTRALASFELGHATAATRYGLALGTAIPLSLRPQYATLVLGEMAAPRILLPGEPTTLGDRAEAVQLPLLADDRDITERARERGDARWRAALCVSDDGRVLIARLRHDSSDALAVALRMAGCRRVVELDRGSHHPAFVHRAGTDATPRQDSSGTSLWALARSAGAVER
jgi:hypothetical protein